MKCKSKYVQNIIPDQALILLKSKFIQQYSGRYDFPEKKP